MLPTPLSPSRSLLLLGALLLPVTRTALAASPTVVKMERAARELAATFVYEGLVRGHEPLGLLDNPTHGEFWFTRPAAAVEGDLRSAAEDRVYRSKPLEPARGAGESPSPLLAARARRASKTTQVVPPDLQTPPPVPAGAELVGEEELPSDRRGGASRALVRQKLSALAGRRAALEDAVASMLDPLAAPKLPAMDLAVLLLFLSEIEEAEDLPLAVACKEAAALCSAYSGGGDDAKESGVRHVQGLLGSYAKERLGREA